MLLLPHCSANWRQPYCKEAVNLGVPTASLFI